jgi:hypothetical protein
MADLILVDDLAQHYGRVTHTLRQHLMAKGIEIDEHDRVAQGAKLDRALSTFDKRGKVASK